MRLAAAIVTAGWLAISALDSSSQEFSPTYPAPLNTDASTDTNTPNFNIYDNNPHLATDNVGHWVAVWNFQDFALVPSEGDDFDLRVARSADYGATWSAPAPLNTNFASDERSDRYPQVATDGNGHWVTVWQSDDSLGDTIDLDDDILVSRSADNGATWTAPMALNTNAASDSGADTEPRLVTDGAGHWIAVWTSTDRLNNTIGNDPDILVSRSGDNGATWSAPMALNTNASSDAGHDRHPQIATDEAGHWVTVWQSWDNLNNTIGQDYDILTARSTDNGATWTPTAALNTDASSDMNNEDHDFAPLIATNKAGIWMAIWEKDRASIANDEVYVVARSTNNGATWTPPAPTNLDMTDEGQTLTTDGIGNWVLAWGTDEAPGGMNDVEWDLWFSRSTNNGATWASPAILNLNASTDSGSDLSPCIAVDADNNWIAVWMSNDSLGGTIGTDDDILFTRWSWAVADMDNLYVDFDAILNGPGTLSAPRNNLTDTVIIANEGATLHIAPGSSSETFIGSNALGMGNQPMTLIKNGSGAPVRIGAP